MLKYFIKLKSKYNFYGDKYRLYLCKAHLVNPVKFSWTYSDKAYPSFGYPTHERAKEVLANFNKYVVIPAEHHVNGAKIVTVVFV